LPTRELHQVRVRRYGALRLAWRRQAVPARGLPQGSSIRRHASLVMNLQVSILMAQTTDPRFTARRMEGASAASRRAAPSQSFKLAAACTAGFAQRARSPTMRRRTHRNSLARPRRP
jgi:hypothetical protein